MFPADGREYRRLDSVRNSLYRSMMLTLEMTQRDDPAQENTMLYEDVSSICAASQPHIYSDRLHGPI